MIIIGLRFVIVTGLLFFCQELCFMQQRSVVRVINNTNEELNNVMIYATPFGQIKPNDSTAYVTVINKDSEAKNPMLYLTCRNINMGSYVSLPKHMDTVYFLINEVKINKRLIEFKQIIKQDSIK
ncbi:hypothetical protein MQE36_15115 [Zhouia spongiae]|uniref:Uncharacterized protein n=1 Tax=Zhouia spongiae TaxID=2202721 RepID=A0ABY3YML3_9FLAO|nr:hypothetical protein [Zhouia spongiae]UNY98403.1 hypothetical protein MQE36_15115 [Zhouia spongiae]